MNNRGDLTDDELVEKMREVAEKSGFNTKKTGLKKTD
jgi:tRNA G26 N,N-dimethylase Trm1